MIRNRLILLAVVLASCSRTPRPAPLAPDNSLVGREFLSELPGSKTIAAALLTTPGDFEYAVHHLRIDAGERLIVTRLIGRDAMRRPRYRILAAVTPPLPRSNEVLVLAECRMAGALDPDIVALARREPGVQLTRIRRAWRASGPNATFAPIAVRGIVCKNEAWRAPGATSASPEGRS